MTQRKLILLTLSLFLAGVASPCKAADDATRQVQEKEKKGKIVRTRDLVEFRNYFKQLGLAYATFEAEQGKGPKSKEDLKPYLQGANKLLEMLDKGDIVFFYGVNKQQMEKGTSNTILAHEAYEDINGRRLVLMGDGSVHELNNEEFAKAPKAKN